MGEDFRRSRRFGVVGVFVVAGATAAIGLTLGSGSAHPTAAIALILAIVFAYVAALLVLQRRDVERASARSRAAAAAAAGPVTDPTSADQIALLEALATAPVDRAAVAGAGDRVWDIARGSINSGAVIMVLIFCAVVPWMLFQFAWSLVVFVPLIVGYALFLSARALGPGGTLDQGYESSAATLAPLGLRLTGRPQVSVRPRPLGPGAQKQISGAVVYEGTRHGRGVRIEIDGSGSSTALSAPTATFEVAARGERLRAAEGAPVAVAAALEPLRASSWWRGVSARGGADGVVVERSGGGAAEHWLRDLWLAERLADSAPA